MVAFGLDVAFRGFHSNFDLFGPALVSLQSYVADFLACLVSLEIGT